MNNNPSMANTFNGRVAISIKQDKNPHPMIKTIDFK